jgi:hypothetical protein
MSHLVDKIVKKVFGTYPVYKELKKYKPDWCLKTNNTIFAIEYENSSRGLLTHTAKYIDLGKTYPKINYDVLMLRSKTHQEKHHQDYHLAKIIKDIQSNVHIEIIDSEDTIEFLQSIKKKALN